MHPLQTILQQQKQGVPAGIYSCCSANTYVLRAALQRASAYHTPLLIEATANQVNQYGGYMNMTPADFYRFVQDLAKEYPLEPNQVILGLSLIHISEPTRH